MKNIGERLSHLLKQNGMTQRELAKKVNVTEAAMSRYMQGTRVPRAETLSKMAKNLNTTTDFILTGENLTPLEESFSKDFYEMYKIAIKISPKMTMQQRKTIIDILLEWAATPDDIRSLSIRRGFLSNHSIPSAEVNIS